MLIRERPEIIVLPKFSDAPSFVQRLAEQRVDGTYRPIIIVLPTELIVWGMDQEELSQVGEYVAGEGDLSAVDLALCWNPRQASMLRRFTNINEEALAVTGHPRFDYFTSPFYTSIPSREALFKRYGVPEGWRGKIVTVATNFVYADKFGHDDTEEYAALKAYYTNRPLDPLGGSFDFVVEDEYLSRSAFVTFCKKISSAVPDVWVILKPHPQEDASFYLNALEDTDRLSVVYQEFSFNFLSVSNLHVMQNCTTGREAWLMGLPTVNLVPTSESQAFRRLAKPGHLTASNTDQALELARDVLRNDGGPPDAMLDERRRILDDDFQVVDGQRALECARVIDATVRRLDKTRGARTLRPWRRQASFGIRQELSAIYRALRSAGGELRHRRNPSLIQGGRADPHFYPWEQRAWLRRIRSVAVNTPKRSSTP